MRFRFDDISINSDIEKCNAMTDLIFDKFQSSEVIWAVSPTVFNVDNNKERVFPSILNAYSNKNVFFNATNLGIPNLHHNIKTAGHGLYHIDHRLLDYGAQEMSILGSCYLVGAKIFVPPFNKYNKDTEQICIENGIVLIKWENNWLSCEHNKFDSSHEKWYIHSYDWTFDKFKDWLK